MAENCSLSSGGRDPSTSCSVIVDSTGFSDLSAPEATSDCTQGTPDYIIRKSRKNQIAPIELFSNLDPDITESASAAASTGLQRVIKMYGVEASIELGVIPAGSSSMRADTAEDGETSRTIESRMQHDECDGCRKLEQDYELLFKEQTEIKRALEDARLQNEAKSRECNEAWASLQELQMELMRKSMHVGSLAFAVEGQVKEKSRWFLSLGDLSKRFRLLKLEHAKSSEERKEYKKCLADMNNMTETIKTTSPRCHPLMPARRSNRWIELQPRSSSVSNPVDQNGSVG